jgi:hypothetical protein
MILDDKDALLSIAYNFIDIFVSNNILWFFIFSSRLFRIIWIIRISLGNILVWFSVLSLISLAYITFSQ